MKVGLMGTGFAIAHAAIYASRPDVRTGHSTSGGEILALLRDSVDALEGVSRR